MAGIISAYNALTGAWVTRAGLAYATMATDLSNADSAGILFAKALNFAETADLPGTVVDNVLNTLFYLEHVCDGYMKVDNSHGGRTDTEIAAKVRPYSTGMSTIINAWARFHKDYEEVVVKGALKYYYSYYPTTGWDNPRQKLKDEYNFTTAQLDLIDASRTGGEFEGVTVDIKPPTEKEVQDLSNGGTDLFRLVAGDPRLETFAVRGFPFVVGAPDVEVAGQQVVDYINSDAYVAFAKEYARLGHSKLRNPVHITNALNSYYSMLDLRKSNLKFSEDWAARAQYFVDTETNPTKLADDIRWRDLMLANLAAARKRFLDTEGEAEAWYIIASQTSHLEAYRFNIDIEMHYKDEVIMQCSTNRYGVVLGWAEFLMSGSEEYYDYINMQFIPGDPDLQRAYGLANIDASIAWWSNLATATTPTRPPFDGEVFTKVPPQGSWRFAAAGKAAGYESSVTAWQQAQRKMEQYVQGIENRKNEEKANRITQAVLGDWQQAGLITLTGGLSTIATGTVNALAAAGIAAAPLTGGASLAITALIKGIQFGAGGAIASQKPAVEAFLAKTFKAYTPEDWASSKVNFPLAGTKDRVTWEQIKVDSGVDYSKQNTFFKMTLNGQPAYFAYNYVTDTQSYGLMRNLVDLAAKTNVGAGAKTLADGVTLASGATQSELVVEDIGPQSFEIRYSDPADSGFGNGEYHWGVGGANVGGVVGGAGLYEWAAASSSYIPATHQFGPLIYEIGVQHGENPETAKWLFLKGYNGRVGLHANNQKAWYTSAKII